MNKIGEVINASLRARGIRQKEFAEKIGVSQATVTKWISGKAIPAADKFIDIVKYLDILEEFFPGYKKVDPLQEMENLTLKSRIEILEAQMGIVKKELHPDLFDNL